MIQSIMLAAMGFVAAALLAVMLAPAYWERAVRLTNERLRSALPVSEQEVRADKDLLRAEYALKVHQLERAVDQGKLAAHRQQIEVNRRDSDILRLSQALTATEASLTEHRNARNVLEQTVSTRIPALESALGQARDLLEARDAALNDLQATAERQAAALEDGRSIMTQRTLEVQRLQALFQEATALGRDRHAEGTEVNMALRAEIESLKARLAERAAVIERLQGEAGSGAGMRVFATQTPIEGDPNAEAWRQRAAGLSAEVRQLSERIHARPMMETAAVTSATPDLAIAASRIAELEDQLRDQAGELIRLRQEADAVALAEDPAANARIRESKIWLRARADRMDAELARERGTTERLKAQVAGLNERIARQANQFREELRRLGKQQTMPVRAVVDLAEAQRLKAKKAHGPEVAAAERPPLTARAWEMQQALKGRLEFAGAKPALPPPVTPALPAPASVPLLEALAPVPPPAVPAPAPEEPVHRSRLLERLKSYEQG